MAKTVKKVEKSVLPFYLVAALWVGYGMFFGLHRLSDFLIAAGLSCAVFAISDSAFRREVEVEIPEVKPEPEKTGNEELDKMVAEGEKALSELRRLDENIADEKISRDIVELEKTTGAIFAQVKAQPEKLPQIRKFMDYYLPTTLKLLNAYDRMSATDISGENIDTTKERVENMMTTIVESFRKQYDSLFGTDALDISTEISVLETMMAREGFTGERMEAETTKNADGTDIKLEL